MKMQISRREFLQGSGAALVVGFSLRSKSVVPVAAAMENPAENWPAAMHNPAAIVPADKTVNPEDLDSWISIAQDGKVTLYTGRIDMGTGIQTAFGQMVADELDVSFESVRVVMGDTGLTPDQGKTTGSSNHPRGSQALRVAAAEARLVLLKLASSQWGVPVEQLEVTDGIIRTQGAPSKQVSYGELIGGRHFDTRLKKIDKGGRWGNDQYLEGKAHLKDDPNKLRVVGRSIPRVDVPAKAVGAFTFVHDVRVPGMLHGRLVRPPAIGATLVSLDESSVSKIPGLVKVVRKGNFVGVVAEREEYAVQASQQLKVTWSGGRTLPEYKDLYHTIRNSKQVGKHTLQDKGDVEAALARATKVFKATYETPLHQHAMLGPSCAVADVKDGQATIWSGSQWIQGNRRDLAKFLGLPVEKVRLIWVEASGSYGRLGCDDAAADAAFLSQAVGKPVRVQWARHEENQWEPMFPAMLFEMRAGLDAQGKIVAFDLQHWLPGVSIAESGNFLAWRLVGGNPGSDRLSGDYEHIYQFENSRHEANFVEEFFRALYMRAPGRIQVNFALEGFLDELASAVKVDPIEFRLRYLNDRNGAAVLNAVARQAGWQSRPSPQKVESKAKVVTGRGMAFGIHEGGRIGVVAEVEVNRDTGKVRVRKLTAATACGRITNPHGLRDQVQGALLHAMSRFLLEEAKFDRTHVTSVDWVSYPVLTFSQAPEIDTVLIDRPEEWPEGAAELPCVPVAALLSNAIFDATGARLRQAPFTPDRVKAALRDLKHAPTMPQ
jgi:CO/xanthine dehydrogenase Mo-binding subunit